MFERSNVYVDLTPIFLNDPSSVDEIINAINTDIVEGLCLPVFRTEQLVSRIHDNEQASTYKPNELNQEEIKQWAERIKQTGFKIAVTPLDRARLPWIIDEISPDYLITHPGDLTFKRLHQELDEQETPVIVRSELAPDSEVERTISWYSNNKLTIVRGIPSDLSIDRRLAPTDRLRAPDSVDVALGLSFYGQEFEHIKQCELESEMILLGPESGNLTSLPKDIAQMEEALSTDTDKTPEQGSIDTDDLDERLVQYRRRYRRSLMADQSISAGSTLSMDDIRELRPAEGLPADKIDQCDGMLVPRPTDPQEIISYS